MSKQSVAKEEQGYRIESPRCGNCYHFTSDSVPIKWIIDMNAHRIERGHQPPYDMTLPENQKEANLRCILGKFTVKKTAHCDRYRSENVNTAIIVASENK